MAGPVRLFSYGTLQLDAVQMATFGRRLEGQADAMPGYRAEWLEIRDAEVLKMSGERFHPVVCASDDEGDRVAGTVFAITAAELEQADAYEVADYRRTEVVLASGLTAWVYVKA